MRFRSLHELIKSRQHCPICERNLSLGFNIVNDKAYIKYRRQDEDVFMIANTVSNDVTYTAFKRPMYRNELSREENVFLANCKKREVHVHNNKVVHSNYEYGISFSLIMDSRNQNITEVELLNEKFFIVDRGIVNEVVINYKTDQITIAFLNDKQSEEVIVTTPLSFITVDGEFNREYLIKKIRTVSLLS